MRDPVRFSGGLCNSSHSKQ